MLQSAAPKISSVVTARVGAAEVLALLTECTLNMLISIPASTMICFSHLAMVDVQFDEGDKQLWNSSQFPCPLYIEVQGVYRTEFTVLCKFGKKEFFDPFTGSGLLSQSCR